MNIPDCKPKPTILTGYWISDGWIYHRDQAKTAKYWIDQGWIYGPVGAGTGRAVYTGYWIENDWIWGPAGKSGDDVYTGLWINEGYIYGPSATLPFVRS